MKLAVQSDFRKIIAMGCGFVVSLCTIFKASPVTRSRACVPFPLLGNHHDTHVHDWVYFEVSLTCSHELVCVPQILAKLFFFFTKADNESIVHARVGFDYYTHMYWACVVCMHSQYHTHPQPHMHTFTHPPTHSHTHTYTHTHMGSNSDKHTYL